jgi:hypothetical protein
MTKKKEEARMTKKKLQQINTEPRQLDLFQDVKPQPKLLEIKNKDETISKQWLTVHYQPVSLFSLKRSDATSMAAKSNLVPTPYSIQMALLKVLIETKGYEHREDFDNWIENEFKWIKKLKIYIQPPKKLVVNRNGYKLRYMNSTAEEQFKKKHGRKPKVGELVLLVDGFVFREWVYMEGNLSICCGETDRLDELKTLFSLINYFGKRGCFFQYLPDKTQKTEQPQYQTNLTNSFTVQPMDELGDKATFNRINPYSSDAAKLDRDRIIKPGFLPLKLTATSARYDLYTRTNNTDSE